MDMGNALPDIGKLLNLSGLHFNGYQDVCNDSEFSSSESEDETTVDFNKCFKQSGNHQCNRPESKRFFLPESTITLDTVKKIEDDLDFYEFISLLFLIYNDEENDVALQAMYSAMAEGQVDFTRDKISNWALYEPHKWQTKLVEALAIIQNYKVLHKLGLSRDEVTRRFNPTRDATVYVSRIKKMLYTVCEGLSKEKAEKLVKMVRAHAKFVNDVTLPYETIHLEFFILFWISRDYITIGEEINLKNLTMHLKVLDFLDKVEEINNMVDDLKRERKIKTSPKTNDDIYPIIDPTSVGLCIIMNIDKFKINVEKRKQFMHLLPTKPLDDRKGSFEDVKRLKKTFNNHLNFVVVEVDNSIHDEFEKDIETMVKNYFKPSVHSVFVLCILSHGNEGVVYAANSIPVKIQDVQNMLSSGEIHTMLADKPKVIIIQACQGTKPLCVNPPRPKLYVPDSLGAASSNDIDSNKLCFDGNELCFDGPEKFTPRYADVLTCLAIIEGFVAVRSTIVGTKYIQELCRCLEEYFKRDHLIDIITSVHNTLNQEKMHLKNVPENQTCCDTHDECLCVYMTPTYFSTLRKKLYLVKRS